MTYTLLCLFLLFCSSSFCYLHLFFVHEHFIYMLFWMRILIVGCWHSAAFWDDLWWWFVQLLYLTWSFVVCAVLLRWHVPVLSRAVLLQCFTRANRPPWCARPLLMFTSKVILVHCAICEFGSITESSNFHISQKRVFILLKFIQFILHIHNCLKGLCPGLPGWAGTRRNIHSHLWGRRRIHRQLGLLWASKRFLDPVKLVYSQWLVGSNYQPAPLSDYGSICQ